MQVDVHRTLRRERGRGGTTGLNRREAALSLSEVCVVIEPLKPPHGINVRMEASGNNSEGINSGGCESGMR